jgi:ATP-dependent Lhr-like helicase
MAQTETPDAAIRRWYKSQGWTRFAFQRAAWRAYGQGRSGLIHSPTGSGKTLAAWLGPVREALAAPPTGKRSKQRLKVLWITPLRALATDTCGSLQTAVDGVGLDWRVELRTGDTSSSVRARQRRSPPDALVTTPESLSLLQSYADADAYFGQLDAVIVDEWHELLGNKRGVLLQLSLSRLRALRPSLRVWGLSATLGNLDEAMQALIGSNEAGVFVNGPARKPADIRSIIPENMESFPWAGHLGLKLLPEVIDVLAGADTNLVFTNTRSQCEQWFEAISRARTDWLGQIALHHGAVDRDHRRKVEDLLRAQALRCVVCTSSLDLGVDFPGVDQVLQIGSPKGVGRLIQRAGRSHHQPGKRSRVICVPTHAFELLEIGAARQSQDAGRIEARHSPRLSLDVLVQHLVTLALGGGFVAQEALAEVRSTYAFAELDDDDWQWALDFITRGGRALQGYPQYRRVALEDGRYVVTDRGIGARHRMSVGTITSDALMRVAFGSGGTLGYIEESFVSKLRRQDRFVFAGRLLRLINVRDMTAYVQLAKPGKRAVPRWQGGRMPLSTELADSVLALCESPQLEPESRALDRLFDIQRLWSRVPDTTSLLVEKIKVLRTHSLFFYPFAGRLAHEGLATVVAHRLTQQRAMTLRICVNDYGFELLSETPFEINAADLAKLLSVEHLLDDLQASLNMTELARRQFREIARIGGLVFQGYPSKQKATRQIHDVLKDYDAENLLLRQARHEVLEGSLDYNGMLRLLQQLEQREIVVVEAPALTPFAFPLWASRQQTQTVSSETMAERMARTIAQLEKKAARA